MSMHSLVPHSFCIHYASGCAIREMNWMRRWSGPLVCECGGLCNQMSGRDKIMGGLWSVMGAGAF